jgi:6-phosphogluconolactonase
MFLYTGGYTKAPDGRGDGIGIFRFDPEAGQLEHVDTFGEIVNPSFLTVSADGRFLYAANEGDGEGSVTAYARDLQSGGLRELNRQSSQGRGPCHVSIDHSGRYVLVANYGSGSIAALPIADDGSLGVATGAIQQEGSSVNPDRQEGPHAHMIASSPDGTYVFATDLGADRIFAYRLDLASGELTPVGGDSGARSEPGSGPRHFAFAPDGQTVYVINELGFTLTRYAYDAETGRLDPQQTVPTLPEGFDEWNLCAHVLVSPDGRFVYGSNRGHDSIAIWAVDAGSGELTLVKRVSSNGAIPRNFTLDPSGAWLLVANQESDTVVVSPRDAETGLPGEPVAVADVASCSCLVFAGA